MSGKRACVCGHYALLLYTVRGTHGAGSHGARSAVMTADQGAYPKEGLPRCGARVCISVRERGPHLLQFGAVAATATAKAKAKMAHAFEKVFLAPQCCSVAGIGRRCDVRRLLFSLRHIVRELVPKRPGAGVERCR